MEFPEDRILSYSRLSDAEQQEVEAFVDAHPEWAPLLTDVKHLREATSASPADDNPSESEGTSSAAEDTAAEDTAAEGTAAEDMLLAFYVTATYVEPGTRSQKLREAFQHLEDRAASDERLAQRIELFRERIWYAESDVSPVAQFESLSASKGLSSSSRSLESMTEPLSSSSNATPADAANDSIDTSSSAAETTGSASELGGVLGWVARWPPEVQWAFAAIFVAGCLAAALWGVDQLTRSPLDELAAVEASQTRIEGYRMDAMASVADSDSVSADRLFLQALMKLREARTTTLGLFPRYDDEALSQGQTLLQQAVDMAEPGSFVGLEARFFLAKSYLAEKRVSDARGELQILARRDSRRAAESVTLLQNLQRVAPIATPDSLASPYD